MKKALCIIVAIALTAGASGYSAALSDIGGHWAESNIDWMVKKEFLAGYADSTFKPNNPVTRAEFATMIVKAGTFDRNRYRDVFRDVKVNDWHSLYVQTAYDKGWIKGSDGIFKPNDQISRAEMAVIMGRIVKSRSGDPSSGKAMVYSFADSGNIPTWAKEDMSYVLHNSIMKGKPGNKFDPEGSSTRAEAATVIYNTLQFFGNV